MITNLTQHESTEEQIALGVEKFAPAGVRELLTFKVLPTKYTIEVTARALACIAKASHCKEAMIGGAPYLMGPLVHELKKVGVQPLYSFSERSSVEERQPDGSVKKLSVFHHAGWIEA